jgi:tetratricopeptide (TPR) repeat protein
MDKERGSGDSWQREDRTRVAGDGLGALIADCRRAAGLTQRELAQLASVGLGTVRDLEQGRSQRSRSVARLAAALGLDATQALASTDGAREARTAIAVARGARQRTRRGGGGGLWLAVLGPLEALRGGLRVGLGPLRQRALLGLLAVNAGEIVRRESVIDALWGDDPPATAVNLVQAYVSRLRKVLDPGRSPRGRDGLLVSVGASYRLRATAGELDLLAFRQMTDRARAVRSAGDATAACELYENALDLWRGEPLADLGLLRGHLAVAHLAGQFTAIVMEYAETASEAGCPERALGRLQQLARAEPLNERAGALLMIVLASGGRQDAALRVYNELRSRLDEQLGMRPSPELAEAHLRVLRQEVPRVRHRGQSGVADLSGRMKPASAIPRQLPPTVAHFTGREDELATLAALIKRPGGAKDSGAAVVISAIDGTAGVGKTALAVHWAHRAAPWFPDGQLYVNLRGYDPGQPMPTSDALAVFLRSLGVPAQDVPADEDERAARYRSMLADKRILVILDNAASAEQVRPLLPGSPSCTVVVTSRDTLAGLVAREGAKRLDLNLLPLDDAVDLLRALIGARAGSDSDTAARLALQCCRLPLALRVAAELAASRPAVPLAKLTAELADQRQRLDLLDPGGDPRTAVRAVFSWSYRNLDASTARTFWLLGLHPGSEFEPYAAAALTNATLGQARRAIDVLARAHLVQQNGEGRYVMHDLLRAYARELAVSQSSEQERRAALTRLFDHYLHAAAAMAGILFPAERRQPAGALPTPISFPPAADPAEARAYLDSELPNLAAVVAHTAEHGWPGHTTRLAATLHPYLEIEYVFEAFAVHGHALRAARAIGDRSAEAEALASLGGLDFWQGRLQEAVDGLHRALALFREAGDRPGEARVLGDLGIVGLQQGRYQQAVSHLQRALALHREAGNRSAEARVLSNLGRAAQRLGDYPEAAAHYNQALVMSRDTGDRIGEAYTLLRLSVIDLQQACHQQAVVRLRQALALFRVIRHRAGEAEALSGLGQASLRQGRHRQAADYFQQALTLFRKMGDVADEAEALNGLGEVMLADGEPGQARTFFGRALDLARQAGVPYDQACAHNGLGHVHHTAGDHKQARHHWKHALDLFGQLGAPEAEQVQGQLRGCPR